MYSQSIALITVSVIFPLLALLAVGLRIWARFVSQTSFNASDYTIFITLVSFRLQDCPFFLACLQADAYAQIPAIGQGILSIVGGTIGGLGAPLASLSPSVTTIFMKVKLLHRSDDPLLTIRPQVLFGSQFFLVFSIVLVKVSIVLFYKQIFTTPVFRKVANITFVVLAATLVAMFFVTLFQDHPISRNWTSNGTTIDFTVFYIFTAALEAAYDLAILCLPLPMIRGLHLSKRRKWVIAGIFWLGGL